MGEILVVSVSFRCPWEFILHGFNGLINNNKLKCFGKKGRWDGEFSLQYLFLNGLSTSHDALVTSLVSWVLFSSLLGIWDLDEMYLTQNGGKPLKTLDLHTFLACLQDNTRVNVFCENALMHVCLQTGADAIRFWKKNWGCWSSLFGKKRIMTF